METDLEALMWDFRSAITIHRLRDARRALDLALKLSARQGVDRRARFSIAIDAGTMAQFTGDLPGARGYAEQFAAASSGDPLHQFWTGFFHVRQATLSGRIADAATHVDGMLDAARSTTVGPARQAVVIAELAWMEAQLGRLPQAIGLYETAAECLNRLGGHPEWASDLLFQLARLQVQAARDQEERREGGLHGPDDAAGRRAGRQRPALGEALWRRAAASLGSIRDQHVPGWEDGLSARAVTALRSIALKAGAARDDDFGAFTALSQAYDAHRIVDSGVWSDCELARLHLQRDDPGRALQMLSRARLYLPATGFAALREKIDFVESMAHRRLGDHRRSLIAYQRYAQRAFERRSRVPAALLDGSLSERATRFARPVRRGTRWPTAEAVALATVIGPAVRPMPSVPASGPHAAVVGAPDPDPGTAGTLLTPREREVMGMVCEGLVNRQIADLMRISPFTVRNHLLSIFRKLGVGSRTEAAGRFCPVPCDGAAAGCVPMA